MHKRNAWPMISVALLVLLSGCGPSPTTSPSGAPESRPSTPKRITTIILSDPPSLAPGVGPVPGRDELRQLVNVGLTVVDAVGTRQPMLAEAFPTVDNGLWNVLPDGRMETTWTLRPGIVWHDGAPFTTDDLVFSAQVLQDRELGIAIDAAFAFIQNIEAVDARTIRVSWRRPYIWADDFFTSTSSMPKHLLERTYTESKEDLLNLPFWTDDFVGNGPFKMTEWVRGSHIIVKANDRYAVGKPKLDEILVRFVLDPSTLVTNILAGSVDLSMSRGISLEQSLQIRNQWRDGQVYVAPSLQILMYPQFMPPTPPIMGDVRFRRALLQSIDRQALVDNLMGGQSSVAHTTILRPTEPEYKEVESSIVRYEYEPRAAAEAIEGLGFSKGADGFYRDAANQPLVVEIHTSVSQDSKGQAMLAIADAWQQLGVTIRPVVFPVAKIADSEYLMTRPGFYHVRHPHNMTNLESYLHSTKAGIPENRFSGMNYARYSTPEMDVLLERFNSTIPTNPRRELLKQIVHHVTDQVIFLGLFYDVEVTAIGNRMKNVTGRGEGVTKNWDSHIWDAAD